MFNGLKSVRYLIYELLYFINIDMDLFDKNNRKFLK